MSIRAKYEAFRQAVGELTEKEIPTEFLSKETYDFDEAIKLAQFSVAAAAMEQFELIIEDWIKCIEESEERDE